MTAGIRPARSFERRWRPALCRLASSREHGDLTLDRREQRQRHTDAITHLPVPAVPGQKQGNDPNRRSLTPLGHIGLDRASQLSTRRNGRHQDCRPAFTPGISAGGECNNGPLERLESRRAEESNLARGNQLDLLPVQNVLKGCAIAVNDSVEHSFLARCS